MKRTIIIIFAILSLCAANAQSDFKAGDFRQKVADKGNLASPSDIVNGIEFSDNDIAPDNSTLQPAKAIAPVNDSITLNLPTLTDRGTMAPINMFPYYYWGYNSWDLHPGMNVNLGASVFASFGKGANSGAGFAQNISMMYAVPLSKKLSLALGGYFDNINWGRYSSRNVGLNAVLGYQFDEHWSGYVYLQKSLANDRFMPRYMYGMSDIGDRIGAAVRYAPTKNFSFEVSVESNRR